MNQRTPSTAGSLRRCGTAAGVLWTHGRRLPAVVGVNLACRTTSVSVWVVTAPRHSRWRAVDPADAGYRRWLASTWPAVRHLYPYGSSRRRGTAAGVPWTPRTPATGGEWRQLGLPYDIRRLTVGAAG